MTILTIGLLLFFVPHLIPILGLRNAVVGAAGENAYKGILSLLSLAGLVTIGFGMAYAPFEPVYNPQPWSRHLLMSLMPFSLILFAAANFPNNIRSFTRHPMMIGTLLWSGGHLLANGDCASIMLFGSFAIFALLDIISGTLRGKTPPAGPHPFKKDLIAIVSGLVVFALIFYFHGALFGMPLISSG